MSLDAWIGRSQEQSDVIDPARAQAMQAALDRREEVPLVDDDPLPALWHWLYFWEPAPQSAPGDDGHAALGEFLPPVALPQRMWAGGRFVFERPLSLGARVRRRSTIASIAEKEGRSGPLAFVTVRHELSDEAGLCFTEEHDIVYRQPAAKGRAKPAGMPAPAEAAWTRRLQPDAVLLFRYSALTFNGHRIHYDIDYCREEAGYPGLVVHGPLQATLLMDLLAREGGGPRVRRFDYRATSPVFTPESLMLAGRPIEEGAELWIADGEGNLAMEGTAFF